MTNILKLQKLEIEGVEEPCGLAASSQSNNCGNTNSGLSVVC
jgi:hypothetical protein